MKVVQLNCVSGSGSTGKICNGISQVLEKHRIENKIFYTAGKSSLENAVKYSDEKYIQVQALKSRIWGNYGFNSQHATKKLIHLLSEYNPDIVHIHNIHGHDCNLEFLFRFFKERKIKLVWTFHDCWAFTGYCTYFSMSRCDKWKDICSLCPQKKNYSWILDKSKENFLKKRKLFSNLDLTIVTPSYWLAGLVKQSFLKEYPVQIINNGIDLAVFRPKYSDFRKKHKCSDKFILLGVSYEWEKRKGLDVFIELAKCLPERFQVVLVGTNSEIEHILPNNIISIHRTANSDELAELYSTADLFVNPTREDNFPTVNIESLACGTPVLTFDTGGSKEIIDSTCGREVVCNDIDGLVREVYNIEKNICLTQENCIKRAKKFDMYAKFEDYYILYRKILNQKRN